MPDDTPAFRIVVEEDGPLVVHGAPPMRVVTIATDGAGDSRGYTPGRELPLSDPARLCRCGLSSNKPYCDDSHLTAQVDQSEDASFRPIEDHARKFEGERMTLLDNSDYCAYGRFCDPDGGVWAQVRMAGEDHEQITRRMVRNCPGGRLVLRETDSRAALEEPLEPGLQLIEDPGLGDHMSGPIRVTGGIPVISASGRTYEVRNRQALCRCGASGNKPFCDGSHETVRFTDGLDEPPLPESASSTPPPADGH